MRAKDFVTEARSGVLRLLKQQLPGWPEYVVRDMVLNRVNKGRGKYPVTPDDDQMARWAATDAAGQVDTARYNSAIAKSQDDKWAETFLHYVEALKKIYPVREWRKETVTLNWDSWDPFTKSKLQDMLAKGPDVMSKSINRHIARLGTQDQLLKQQGGIKEPLILVKRPTGYELVEGHHRVLSLLRSGAGEQGFAAPAYVGYL